MRYIISAVFLGFYSVELMAASISWTGLGGTTDWFLGTNWSTTTVPTNADNATIGDTPNNNVQILNGSATANAVTFSSTSLTVGTNGTLSIINSLLVNDADAKSAATFRIENGGSVSIGNDLQVALSNTTATAIVTGTDSTLTSLGNTIGAFGVGALQVEAGAQVTTSSTAVGSGTTAANSSLLITGANTSYQNTGTTFIVGFQAQGFLTVSNGATLQSSTGEAVLGTVTGGIGSGVIDGVGSSWTHAASITLGRAGANGDLLIKNGGTVNADGLSLSRLSTASVGTLTIQDSGSSMNITNSVNIGSSGAGTVIVKDGALLSVGGLVTVGSASTSSGTLNVLGTAGNRGILSTQAIFRGFGASAVTVDGGILQAQTSFPFFISQFNPGEFQINSGGVFIDSNGFDIGAASVMGGTGSVTKEGAGEFAFSVAQAYTGTTEVNAGSLALAAPNAASTSSAVNLNNAGATLSVQSADQSINNLSGVAGSSVQITSSAVTFNNATSTTYNGTFTSDNLSSIIKAGSTTRLTLTAASPNFLGSTTVAGGILDLRAINALSNSSQISLGSGTVLIITTADQLLNNLSGLTNSIVQFGSRTLTDNNTQAISFDGRFTGTNASHFIKQGAGLLTLTANSNNFLGLTTVNSGDLAVDGTLGGTMTVAANGRLLGTGTVGTSTIFGHIAPGNSIGTLHVAGNYTQASGSAYELEINPTASDLIQITGTAVISPNTSVIVTPAAGTYTERRYTIMDAAAVNGTYSNLIVTNGFVFFDLLLNYDANHVYLDLVKNNQVSLVDYAKTPNEKSVAQALNTLTLGNDLYNAIISLSVSADIPDILNSLSGEIYASTLAGMIQESHYLRDALLSYLDNDSTLGVTTSVIAKDKTLWAHILGASGTIDGDGNAATFSHNAQGIFLGIDQQIGTSNPLRLGILAGHTQGRFKVSARSSTSDNDANHLGLYAHHEINQWFMNGGAAYSWYNFAAMRNVNFISNALTNDYSANTAQVFGELGYNWAVQSVKLKPLVNLAYIASQYGRGFEQGGISALNLHKAREDMLFSTVGAREAAFLYRHSSWDLKEYLLLGWQHAYSGLTPQSIFNFEVGSSPFLISGTPLARNALLVDASLEAVKIDHNATIGIAYIGQFASNIRDNAIAARLRWVF